MNGLSHAVKTPTLTASSCKEIIVIMVILLFGPPGCGKGTQSAIISRQMGLPAVSTGEILRAEMRDGTPLGVAAKKTMESGDLVSDEIINGMIRNRLAQPDCRSGCLLDGYPRTLAQAEYLEGLLKDLGYPPPVVLFLDVPEPVLIARLTARRQCPVCGAIYNLLSKPPRQDGVCDNDGATLFQRDDDNEDTIRARLEAYARSTGPLIEYYAGNNLHRLDGNRRPEEIQADVDRILAAVRDGAKST